jgi:hypothetical protein
MLLTFVTSEDDLARSLGVDGSASFGNGLFSADASVQYLSNTKMTSYSSYLLVTSGNENAKQILTRYTLTSDARKALKAGLPQFVKLCGDQFVRGRITGGSISAIMSASSTTAQEQVDASATLHAAGWGGSLDVATQSKLQSYQSAGRLNIQIIRQGPAEKWPTGTVANLITYAQDFPSKVASKSQSAWVMSYVVSTYDQIYQTWKAPASQVLFFSKEGIYLRELYQKKNNYSYIQANQDQFGPTSGDKLTNAIAALSTEITRVKAAADKCLSDQHQCSPLQHIKLDYVPDRTEPWQSLDPKVNIYRNFYTVVSPDRRVVELHGDFYTQCQNHPAGIFGPTQWMLRFMSTKTGAKLYEAAYPGRPVRVPEDAVVSVRVIDGSPDDNCAVDGQEPKIRSFTPVFSDDWQ